MCVKAKLHVDQYLQCNSNSVLTQLFKEVLHVFERRVTNLGYKTGELHWECLSASLKVGAV